MKTAIILASLGAFAAALPKSNVFNPSHEEREPNTPSASCPKIMAVSNITGNMAITYYDANPDGQLSLNNHPCHGTWEHDHNPLVDWLTGIFGLDPDGYGHFSKHPANVQPNNGQGNRGPMHLVAGGKTGQLHGVVSKNAEQADEGKLGLLFKQFSTSSAVNYKGANTEFAFVVPDNSSATVSQRAVAATAGESEPVVCQLWPCQCVTQPCASWQQCYNSSDAGSKNIYLSSAHPIDPYHRCEDVWVVVSGSTNETAIA